MKNTHVFIGLFILLIGSSCQVGRYIYYNTGDISDHEIFPYTEINMSENPHIFTQGKNENLAEMPIVSKEGVNMPLSEYIKEETTTAALLVVRNDSILFEQYSEKYEESTISNTFSVSKSVVSLLIGIALDEGHIESIQDPVTKYIPEFKNKAPEFEKLTIAHLLNMRSGIKFKEQYLNPFSHIARLYYGKNQIKFISKLKFEHEPGGGKKYLSVCTAILGIVLEKTTNKEVGEYLEEKVWLPMGMEHRATWSVDDKKNRSTKAYCCLNTTVRDLAKIGQLYLNHGKRGKKQIVSREWIEYSLKPNFKNGCYQNQWYRSSNYFRDENRKLIYYPDSLAAINAVEESNIENFEIRPSKKKQGKWLVYYCSESFYAQGIHNQFLYVNPGTNTIVIRLGKKWDKIHYLRFLMRIDEYINGYPSFLG